MADARNNPWYLICQGCYEYGARTIQGCLDHEEAAHNNQKQLWITNLEEV